MDQDEQNQKIVVKDYLDVYQLCPVCGKTMGALPGTKDAICQNCGFKDPCCE